MLQHNYCLRFFVFFIPINSVLHILQQSIIHGVCVTVGMELSLIPSRVDKKTLKIDIYSLCLIFSIKRKMCMEIKPASLLLFGMPLSPSCFLLIKGWMQCFTMQVAMNNCFLLNPEKIFGTDPSCRFREKRKKRTV